MKILTLDFETYDPLLLKYGMGWCFKYHYPECEFEVLGCGLIDYLGDEYYLSFTGDDAHHQLSLDILESFLITADAVVCHNCLYDIGALRFLFKEQYHDLIGGKLLIDTQLLAKHENQHRMNYSLDNLCKVFECVEQKDSDILLDYAWLSGLYKAYRKDIVGKNCHTRPKDNALKEWCMSDMRRFPLEIVKEYCLQDVRATKALYEILAPLISYLDSSVDSDLLKVCIECKVTGVRIDVEKAKELYVKNIEIVENAEDVVHKMLGAPEVFNINSSKIMGELLTQEGYKIPRTDKGNYSMVKDWLDLQPEPIFKEIRRYRKGLKVNEYINKLIKYQEAIPEKYRADGVGYLYPTLRPYGATSTGRFSSGSGKKGCYEINIQQIPRRDEDFGAPMRELFLPHKGERFICCDISSQESRIQVHYAYVMGCTGAGAIVNKYIDDAKTDYHQLVADICNISRENAKTINLGLSYGMGKNKLILSLGIGWDEGSQVLFQYHKLLPFLKQLQHLTKKNIQKLGYIKTIGGRKLRLGPMDYPDKALNKLVQGSAGDQIVRSMIAAHKAGVKTMFSVHDEIVASGTEEDKDKLIKAMCESVPLVLPMYVEGGVGSSWGDAK